MRRTSRLVLAAVVIVMLGGPAQGAAPPPAYADLYAALAAKIAAIDGAISSRWTGEKYDTAFAAELLAANGNQGERLLGEQAWQGVLVSLDAYQQIGLRAVRVAIKYPMLVAGFPRAQDYLAYYRRVADELRRRHLKIFVQMTDAFREPVFSALPVAPYYAGLTFDRYKREKRQMAETIIREIRPDWLTLANEPATDQHNTGLRMGVAEFTEVVRYVLTGLDHQGVRIGAGAGTWDDLAYMQSLAQIPGLDYLDMHVYPINRDYVVDRVFRIAEIARRASKPLVLGETWLYKARDDELGGRSPVAAAADLYGRDAYSFWEPLDARYVATTVNLAYALKLDFVSFFWARYFFGYVEYTGATANLQPAALFQLANQQASRNMMQTPPQLTAPGAALQLLLRKQGN